MLSGPFLACYTVWSSSHLLKTIWQPLDTYFRSFLTCRCDGVSLTFIHSFLHVYSLNEQLYPYGLNVNICTGTFVHVWNQLYKTTISLNIIFFHAHQSILQNLNIWIESWWRNRLHKIATLFSLPSIHHTISRYLHYMYVHSG